MDKYKKMYKIEKFDYDYQFKGSNAILICTL